MTAPADSPYPLLRLAALLETPYLIKWDKSARAAAHLIEKDTGEPHTLEEILESNNPRLVGQWAQIFWEILPDDESIRTEGFYALCDIAEWWAFGDDE